MQIRETALITLVLRALVCRNVPAVCAQRLRQQRRQFWYRPDPPAANTNEPR